MPASIPPIILHHPYHLQTLSSLIPRVHLQSITQRISTLNEQRKYHTNTAQESAGSRRSYTQSASHHSTTTNDQLTESLSLAIDIKQVIRNSTSQISTRYSIQRPAIKSRIIARDNRSSEQSNILEAVLLRAFGADDAAFCARVEGLVALEFGGVAARGLVVEFLAAEARGVEVGGYGEDPGGRDGVEGLLFSC